MQSSEVISVNIWQIIISICNLLILFLILKKFLYKPVQNMLAQRQGLIDKDLESAREADKAAQANKKLYEEKLKNADEEAAEIIDDAKKKAQRKSDKILSNAKDKADDIVNQAHSDAALEVKKAQAEIKHEITEVSTLLSEKILDARQRVRNIEAQIREEERYSTIERKKQKIKGILRTLQSTWPEMNDVQRQSTCQQLIDRVIIYKDGSIDVKLQLRKYLKSAEIEQ